MIWPLLALIWSQPLWATTSDAVSHHITQAEHFLKRGWVADAEAEYQSAYALPNGPKSTDLASVGARIAWANLDVESAMLRSQELAALSDDPTIARAAHARAESYAQDFGFVEIHGPYDGTRATIRLQAMQPLLDPLLANYSRQLQDTLTSPTMLPARMALPVGPWEINGHPLTISAGQEASISIPAENGWERFIATIQASRLEVSSGFLFGFGPSAQASIPGPVVELRWVQPLHGIELETSVNWNSAWSLNTNNQPQRTAFDFGGSVGFGRDIQTPSALVIRPILGLQAQTVSNIHLDCAPDPQCLHCTQAQLNANEQAQVSANGWALMPMAAIGFDYRPPPGPPVMATGFRLSLLHAIGKSAESGTITNQSEPSTTPTVVHWQVDQTTFHGWQLRLQASVGIAF